MQKLQMNVMFLFSHSSFNLYSLCNKLPHTVIVPYRSASESSFVCVFSVRGLKFLQQSGFRLWPAWLWHSVVIGISNILEESVATACITYLKIQQQVLQSVSNNLSGCIVLLPRGPQLHVPGKLRFFFHTY
jgi:hypothetical protein